MWRLVGLLQTDVSEERVASISRAEENTRERKVLFIYLEDGSDMFLRNVGLY
jgi:hypothetical protein